MNERALSGSIKISSPFEYLKSFSSSFEKTGNWRNLATNAMVDYDRFGGKIEMSTTLQNIHKGQSIEGNLKISTPFQEFNKFQLTATHKLQGYRRYASGLAAEIGNNMARLDTLFNLQSPSEFGGHITMATPFKQAKSVHVEFHHNGGIRQFNNHFEMQHNNQKKISFDSSFALSDVIQGHLKLESPLVRAKSVELDFKHHGNLKAFHSNVDFTLENEKMELSTSFKSSPNIEAKVNLKAPVFQPITVSVSHDGGWKNFRSELDVIVDKKKQVAFIGSMKIDPTIEGGFTLKNPLTDDIKLTFNHRGGLVAFQSEAKLQYNKENTIEGNIMFNTRGNIEGKAHFKSPYQIAKDVALEFSHTGKITDFTSFGKLVYAQDKKIEVNVEFKLQPRIHAQARLQSPWKPVQDLTLTVNHGGNKQNFQSKVDLLSGQSNLISLSAYLKTISGIQGGMTLNTAFKKFENIDLSIKHEGSFKNFKSVGQFTYEQNKKISIETEFKTGSAIQGSLKFSSPFKNMENIALMFNHHGPMTNFHHHIELNYFQGKIQYDGEFHIQPHLKGHFIIQTPYTQDLSLFVDHQGSLKRQFAATAKAAYGQYQVKSDIKMQINPQVEGTISFQSPFTHLKDLSLKVKHRGNLKNFRSAAEFYKDGEKKLQGDAELVLLDSSTEGFVKVQDVGFAFNHRGDLRAFRSYGEVSYGKSKQISLVAEAKIQPTFDARLHFKSPFKKIEDISFTAKHSGDLTAFQYQADLTYYAGRIHVDGSFKKSPLDVKVNFMSPYTSNTNFVITHSGDINAFQAKTELNYGAQKIHLDGSFQKNPLELIVNFNSPIKKFENIRYTLSHKGDVNAFQSKTELSYGQEKIQLEGRFNKNPIEVSVHFSSPFTNIETIKYTLAHSGNLKSFQARSELSYGDAKISADGSFKRHPLK